MNNQNLKKEYYYLYVLSQTFRVLGWLWLIAAVVLLIVGLTKVDLNDMTDAYLIFLSSIGAIMFAIIHFALPEIIRLFVRIEFNTRKDKSKNEVPEHFSSNPESKDYLSYEDWKKTNPNKSINDYYASMMKK